MTQEEELFKWDLTTYPEIDFVTVYIEPYQKLFSAVAKWQRSEKKWMDGAFIDLDAETIEAEVCFDFLIGWSAYSSIFFYIERY